MADRIAAWRNLDGTYTMRAANLFQPLPFILPPGNDLPDYVEALHEQIREQVREAGGWRNESSGDWVVPESALGQLDAYRVFIVILGGFCCAPVSAAEVRPRDLERGKVFRVYCPSCGKRSAASTLWEVPIVEVCGEGEEGQRTYEAAFQAEIEG